MQYIIYINGKYPTGLFSIEDVIAYIIDNDLSIIEENEDYDENTVQIYCKEK